MEAKDTRSLLVTVKSGLGGVGVEADVLKVSEPE